MLIDMVKMFSVERSIQILVYLLKAYGIRRVVVSPGTTNLTLVGSLQADVFFELYSSADERSAAYIACGMAAESNEPVVLSCTGATASRNYMSGLTEAYYRKLPILAITSTQYEGRIGNHNPQVIDRTSLPKDIALMSVHISSIHTPQEEWFCELSINKALLELRHHGGGPVHINMETTYSPNFTVERLPTARIVKRYCYGDEFPSLDFGRIAIVVGNHPKWNLNLQKSVEAFCEKYNAIVACDHTSNYQGKYKVNYSLIECQTSGDISDTFPDLVIHIGEISGASPLTSLTQKGNIWRVSPDGLLRDTFGHLRAIFEVKEEFFFSYYANQNTPPKENDYYRLCINMLSEIRKRLPELPLSNIWLASKTAALIPENAVIHFAIYNSLRSWNLFDLPNGIPAYCNTGGFGIDGTLSTIIGASLVHPEKLFFAVIGDLAFFYDMNSLGNRHVGKNIRILLVNNGRGTEFRNFNHPAAAFGDKADDYMAAAGHYGNQSRELVRHYSQDLGFNYLSASTKQEYIDNLNKFVSPEKTDQPIVFEVFTDSMLESEALRLIMNVWKESKGIKGIGRKVIGSLFGEESVNAIRNLIK